MKKVITEKALRSIVRKCISEAMRYDKGRKQYFPNYTGDPHSDAGKFVSNDRDDSNYSRNNYQWSDPENQKKFERLQWENNFDADPFDPDKENERNAENYLQDREPDTIADKASEEMTDEFLDMVKEFLDKASQRYPALKEGYYMDRFIDNIHRMFEGYDYEDYANPKGWRY